MIKNFLICLSIALFIISCSNTINLKPTEIHKSLSGNYLENGSFEQYQEIITSSLPGWLIEKNISDKVSIDTTRSFHGNNCLKINHLNNELTLVSQPFTISHRDIYGISLSAKSILKPVLIKVNFFTFSESGKIVSKYQYTTSINTEWQTDSLIADFLRVNSEYGRILISVYPSDSVLLIDDINFFLIDSYQKK